MLRSWFAYCEGRGWVRRGLAAAVLLPAYLTARKVYLLVRPGTKSLIWLAAQSCARRSGRAANDHRRGYRSYLTLKRSLGAVFRGDAAWWKISLSRFRWGLGVGNCPGLPDLTLTPSPTRPAIRARPFGRPNFRGPWPTVFAASTPAGQPPASTNPPGLSAARSTTVKLWRRLRKPETRPAPTASLEPPGPDLACAVPTPVPARWPRSSGSG